MDLLQGHQRQHQLAGAVRARRWEVLVWGLPALLSTLPFPFALPQPGGGVVGVDIAQLAVLVAGLLALLAVVAEVSWPLAGLAAWVLVQWVHLAMPDRTTALLPALFGWLLLYRGASRQSIAVERATLLGLLWMAAVAAVLGAVNLTGNYPVLWPQAWIRAVNPPGIAVRPTLDVKPHTIGLPQALFGHPNYWAVAMAFALPVLWWATRSARAVFRWALLVAWLPFVALSRGRTGLVAGIVAATVLLASELPARWRWGALGPAAAAAVGTIGASLELARWAPRLGGRWPVWRVGWQEALRQPVRGHGLGSWLSWAIWDQGPLRDTLGTWATWWTEAQNDYLQLVFELGAPGAILAGAFLVLLARQAIRAAKTGRPEALAAIAIVTAGAVAAATSIPLHHPALALPLVFAAGRVRAHAESRPAL